jgi:hypothetical protein
MDHANYIHLTLGEAVFLRSRWFSFPRSFHSNLSCTTSPSYHYIIIGWAILSIPTESNFTFSALPGSFEISLLLFQFCFSRRYVLLFLLKRRPGRSKGMAHFRRLEFLL